MFITTTMVTIIMLVIWKTSIWFIALFFLVFASLEWLYLSSILSKFIQGGYLPLAFSVFLMTIMAIWHYVHKQRYLFELKNKVSSDFIHDLALNSDINRVPGIGLLYSELVQGIPPIFPHFIANIPSIHSVLVFVSIKSIPISKVATEERFLFRQVEPRDYRMFRCVVRYGYNDAIEEPKEFEAQLVGNLKEFIRHEQFISGGGGGGEGEGGEGGPTDQRTAEPVESTQPVKDGKTKVPGSSPAAYIEESLLQAPHNSSQVSSGSIQSSRIISGPIQRIEEEIEFVQKAKESGVVYLLGEVEVRSEQNSSFLKKIVVNHAYNFLKKNFRQGEKVMAIPQSRLLRVGMTYEI